MAFGQCFKKILIVLAICIFFLHFFVFFALINVRNIVTNVKKQDLVEVMVYLSMRLR